MISGAIDAISGFVDKIGGAISKAKDFVGGIGGKVKSALGFAYGKDRVGRAGTHIITHDIKSTVNKSSDLNVAQALSTGGSSGAITMDIAVKDEVESPHYEGVGVGMAFTKIITHDINSKATNSGNTTVASPVNTATVITIN